MRVLIAGCGYVGAELGLRLVAEGHEVFALRRRPEGLPAGLVGLAADLTDPTSLRVVPGDLDFVFYTASAARGGEAGYRAAYVTGLRHLVARLDSRVQRLFFTSSTAVYAQEGGEWVDESSPTEPRHPTARLLLEGERLLGASPCPATIVRFGGIYGPGRRALIDRVRTGTARIAAGPPRYTNRIHRDDCAGVLRFLMDLAAPEPVYLGVDCEPASERDVFVWMAQQLGAPSPSPGPPEPDGRRARGNKRCSNRRLLDSGYRFRYPTFRDGYAALIAAMVR